MWVPQREYFFVLLQARDAACRKIMQDTGPHAYLIPSSDHPHIIAGQGSIALELLEQVCYFIFCLMDIKRLLKRFQCFRV